MQQGPSSDATNQLKIRCARLEDAESLRQLYIELANGRTHASPPGIDLIREILSEIEDQPARLLLVAEVEAEQIAGTVDLVVVPNLTHMGQPWAVVENVMVAKKQRRRGIGRALMQDAIGHARRFGCYKVQLTSAKRRDDAHDFYRSLGFEAVSEGFKIYFDS